MSEKHLAAYLNDHLAGSVAAIELLEHLEKGHAGTPLAQFLASLRSDITSDQQEVRNLMSRLQVTQSSLRKAAVWMAEKLTEWKLTIDDSARGSLRQLEVLEAVALGIEGKKALWNALAAAAESAEYLRGPDYELLVSRAEEQRQQIEAFRLEAARAALGQLQPV